MPDKNSYTCLWCQRPNTIFQMTGQMDDYGKMLQFICNKCILNLTSCFLRGRQEFELAKKIEKFIGHKLPFEA